MADSSVVVGDVWSFTTKGVPVPIGVFNLMATKSGNSNELSWHFPTNENCYGFYIQRLSESGSWTSIGFVPINANSSLYLFEDKLPLKVSTYRLQQINVDGNMIFTESVLVGTKVFEKLKIGPNPTKGELNINLPIDYLGQLVYIDVYDNFGKKVYSTITTNANKKINITNLAKGNYSLRIKSNFIDVVKGVMVY